MAAHRTLGAQHARARVADAISHSRPLSLAALLPCSAGGTWPRAAEMPERVRTDPASLSNQDILSSIEHDLGEMQLAVDAEVAIRSAHLQRGEDMPVA